MADTDLAPTPQGSSEGAWEYNVEATTDNDDESVIMNQENIQIQFCLPDLPAAEEEPTTHKKVKKSSSFFGNQWLSLSRSFSRDEDDESVKSVAIFEPKDFQTKHWTEAMDAPTIGFAVAGLAMAITHPVFFLAGLVTAWGTAAAASKGYNCLLDLNWFAVADPCPANEKDVVTEKVEELTQAPSDASSTTGDSNTDYAVVTNHPIVAVTSPMPQEGPIQTTSTLRSAATTDDEVVL